MGLVVVHGCVVHVIGEVMLSCSQKKKPNKKQPSNFTTEVETAILGNYTCSVV